MLKKRIEKIRQELKEDEALLITGKSNRLYFTGFNSSAGNILITKKKAVFFIDFRYFEKATDSVKHLQVELCQKLFSQISEILKAEKIKTVFLDTAYVNMELFASIKTALNQFNISDDSRLSEEIVKLRSIKSKAELELIKSAQALTDETFQYILTRLDTTRTEKEIALDMEFFMRKNGSEGISFDFIVASGKNSSLPHAVPTDKKIQKGDFLTLDFGAVVGGYRSDMTRTVAIGEATDFQKEIYNIVLKAQNQALDSLKSGVACSQVDKAARDIINSYGYGHCFGHGLGHSVGIEIHENPACNTRDNTLLQEGMIMTVEPGIYLENQFGVRIEDMVYVTKNSSINLTKSPKNLIII